MEDLGVFVKLLAYAMATKFPDDAEATGFGMTLNCTTDVSEGAAWTNSPNSVPETFPGNPAKPTSLYRWRSDLEHSASVAVISILDDGDVDIEDVSVAQDSFAGYPMANLMIYRGANGFGEWFVTCRGVVKWSWYDSLLVHHVIVAFLINLAGTDSGLDKRGNKIKNFRRQSACVPHFLDLFGRFDLDGHLTSLICD